MASELLTISQLARCVGTSVAVVRAYGNTGLLQPPRPRGKARGRGASFGYDQQHVERVKFVQRALKYNFTIGDIAHFIDAAAPILCRGVHQPATRRLQELQDTHAPDAAPVQEQSPSAAAHAKSGRRPSLHGYYRTSAPATSVPTGWGGGQR